MKMEMKEIKTGSFGRLEGKKDMVFCIIYADYARPYINYDPNNMLEGCYPNMAIPLVLTLKRGKDGKIGFPGGNVDPEDVDLISALKRELKEEINFTNIDESRLITFTTFANDKRHITSFTYRVSEEELDEICKNIPTAQHYKSEITGYSIDQIHTASINGLLNQCYSGTAKNELEALIERKHLLIDQEMLGKAIELVKPYFINKTRDNGNNYFEEHIMGCVDMAKNYPLEYQIVLALHDALEDTEITKEQLLEKFPEFIVDAVEALTLDDSKEYRSEVEKCLQTPLAQYCRYIDRLNNLQHTSVRYNTIAMVNKMITKTQMYYLPVFNQTQREKINIELNRMDLELSKGESLNV